jgi:polysaccharide export outer membrane protein
MATAGWPGSAWSAELAPQTKIRLTVVQWMPAKGQYEQWGALGGEFVVSQAGTVVLPVIGAVSVANLDGAGLAAEVAKRLQAKIGLVSKPDTTVEILQYPPIYVVGDVTKPGEYRFHDGLTVLQALALSGGAFRTEAEKSSQDQIKLVGELRGIETNIVRSMARIARLEAETSQAKEIAFPPVTQTGADGEVAREIFAQERIIFATRANELERQAKSLAELRDLLTAEIGVLEEKIKTADDSITSAQNELSGVKVLVDKGIAVASRQSDLERTLAGFRTDRLDQVTAVMRARQAITEATRNLDGLRDKQRTEIATELQQERSNLEQLRLKRETAQKVLLEMIASSPGSGADAAKPLVYTITRSEGGQVKEIAAREATVLLPGDVVKASFAPVQARDQTGSISGAVAKTASDEASQ